MDSSRKQRGLEGKLMMSFHRSSKPPSMQLSSKVKPTPPSTAFLVEDKFVIPAPMQKPSFAKKEGGAGLGCKSSGANGIENFGEENVDEMAASYISNVQQRFRLPSMQLSSKVKPTPPPTAFLVEDKFVIPAPMQKPSFAKKEGGAGLGRKSSGANGIENFGEENVDEMAASYISNVKQRFRLEQVESDTRMQQKV